jgi:predicted RNase H-like HicB family nuclease
MEVIDSAATAARADRLAGWPDVIEARVWLVREDEHWAAIASDFDVVGIGDSRERALCELQELLDTYLGSFIAEGRPFDEARRPLPAGEELRLRARRLMSPILRWLDRKPVSGSVLVLPGRQAHC